MNNNNKKSHCVKVPQNYKDVSRILKRVIENGIGLKDLIYGNDNSFNRNKQRNFALATKILSKYRTIEHILSTTKLLESEPKLDPWLARVLIHELLWRKDLNYPCTPVQVVISYKKQINDALSTYEEDPTDQPAKKVYKPKYVRVNTFKMSVSDVITQLRNEGMTLIPSQQQTYAEYLELISEIPEYHFMIDFHIKEILVFAHGFSLINHHLYQNGTLIIQDKASCLAPYLLAPHEGASVLDMCAAPGMKSNYLANLVGKNGHVYAVEKHYGRYQTLSNLMKAQGMKNIHCMHKDATDITGNDLADVEYILVDPSCSGSGIVNRVEFEKSQPDRLKKLSDFQEIILRHALTKFRNVKRVTYSTCSLYPEENEEVIRAVLKYNPSFQLVNLKEKLGSNWHHYGSEKYENVGPFCIYTNPEKDLTNGFFIAVFEKKLRNRGKEEIAEIGQENVEEVKEKNKEKKKRSNTEIIEDRNEIHQEEIPETKSKKKRKHKEDVLVETPEISEETQEKKKKKKNIKTITTVYSVEIKLQETVTEEVTKKKKRSNTEITEDQNEMQQEEIPKEKSKKKRKHREEVLVETQEIPEETQEKKKKIKTIIAEHCVDINEIQQTLPEEVTRKKKRSNTEITEDHNEIQQEEIPKEKRKKKRKHREDILLEIQEIPEETQEKKKKIKTVTEEHCEDINEAKQTVTEEVTRKRKRSKIEITENQNEIQQEEIPKEKSKKKRKHRQDVLIETQEISEEIQEKKKKKKKIKTFIEEHCAEINEIQQTVTEEVTKKKHINEENIKAIEDINKENNFQDHNTENSVVDGTKKVKKKKNRVQEDN